MIDTLRHDLVQALRSLRRRPTFAVLAVVTLALGIGATSAIFSVVNGVLLRPLPFERPEELMLVHTRLDGVPGREVSVPAGTTTSGRWCCSAIPAAVLIEPSPPATPSARTPDRARRSSSSGSREGSSSTTTSAAGSASRSTAAG